MMPKIDDETFKLLTSGQNLGVALEIATQLEAAKERIKIDFLGEVAERLKRHLKDKQLENSWKVNQTFDEGVISIRTAGHTNNARNYECRVEKLFNGGWFGWYRPAWVEEKNQAVSLDTQGLSDKMKRDDFWIHGWWVGQKDLPPNYKTFDNETVIATHADNMSAEHPLARELAEILWRLFDVYRVEIEALPSFQAAAR